MNRDTTTLGMDIGVDVGGTFTDAVAVHPTGRMIRAKAFTTPGRHVDGIMDAVDSLASQDGVGLREFLQSADHFSVGTTVVTNSIAELKGRRVGLLTTKGFRDTMSIAKSPRVPTVDPFVQEPMPTIVPLDRIVEIDERVDSSGSVVVPISTTQVVERVAELKENHDVEAIAICFLWSFLNPDHERAARDAIQKEFPELYVSASCDLYPVIREYERMVTTTLNAFVSGVVASYAEVLDNRLRQEGYAGRVSLGQSLGGVLNPEEASMRPLHLFNSGPVGGVMGAVELAGELGVEEFITADMGGTSYDVSLVRNGKPEVTHRAVIDRFETGLSQLDITPVGAGGGSICWIDDRGAPMVGPHSAGSNPGPACYGNGGEHPTVTDIAVLLGLVDEDYFLGGQMKLDVDGARAAVLKHLSPLGDSPEEIAGEIHRIIVQSMIQVVRNASVRRGRDPRGIAMISFGGASSLFAAEICKGVGIPRIIIPEFASVFSAWGLQRADPIRTEARSIQWLPETGDLEHLNVAIADLTKAATENMLSRGFDDGDIVVGRTVDMRFSGQSFDVSIDLPSAELSDSNRNELLAEFHRKYAELYGEGSVWEGFPPVVTTARVVATVRRSKAAPEKPNVVHGAVSAAVGERELFDPSTNRWTTAAVFETESLVPGELIQGPCVVENSDTTIFVPRGSTIQRASTFRGFEMTVHPQA